jgi:hypothetical protein
MLLHRSCVTAESAGPAGDSPGRRHCPEAGCQLACYALEHRVMERDEINLIDVRQRVRAAVSTREVAERLTTARGG